MVSAWKLNSMSHHGLINSKINPFYKKCVALPILYKSRFFDHSLSHTGLNQQEK